MIIDVPYFKQEKDYLCGPATLRMVLAFFNQTESEKKLAKLAGLTEAMFKKVGTPNDKMAELTKTIAKKKNLFAYVKNRADLKTVKKLIRRKIPVIVNYIEPVYQEGHYAVIVGYNSKIKRIILADPLHGKNFSLKENDFISRWKSGYDNKTRWLLVLSDKPIKIN